MFFNRKGRQFAELINRACQSPDPLDQVRCAKAALEQLDGVHPWPRSISRSPRQMRAVLYGVLGQAYGDLAMQEPMQYDALVEAAHQQAEAYFRPEDGEDWVLFQIYRAQSGFTKQGANLNDFETAIERLEALLKHPLVVKTPHYHSSTLGTLVNLYTDIESSDIADARERAVRHGEDHLKLLERTRVDRHRYANAHLFLGQAYTRRRNGNMVENSQRAIEVIQKGIGMLDRRKQANDWAQAQAMLSMAYDTEYIPRNGTVEDSLNLAIAASDHALEVFNETDTQTRIKWARVQYNRLNLFAKRGSKDSDFLAAKEAGEAALRVYTEREFPDQHAELLGKLASLSGKMLDPGDPESIDQSIRQAEADLMRKDQSANPYGWAIAKSRLADLYYDLPLGPDRESQLEEAIQNYEAALKIIGPSNDRQQWIRIVGNLANAYADRLAGECWQNMEEAIRLQEYALANLKPDEASQQWSESVMNLAESYLDRQKGIWADNVEYVIGLLESASIYVNRIADNPRRYRLLKLISRAYHERVRGDELLNLKKAAQAIEDAWGGTIERDSPDYLFAAKLHSEVHSKNGTDSQSGNSSTSSSEGKSEASQRLIESDPLKEHKERIEKIDKDRHPVQWIQAQIAYGQAMLFFGPSGKHLSHGESGIQFSVYADRFRDAFEALDAALQLALEKGLERNLSYIHKECARAAKLIAMLYRMDDMKEDFATFFNADERMPDGKARSYFERALESQKLVAAGAPIEANERAHLYENLELGQLQVFLRDWEGAFESFKAVGRAAEIFLADIEVSDAENRRILKVLDEWMEIAPFTASMCGRDLEAIQFVEQGRARLLTKTTSLALLNLDQESFEQLSKLRTKLLACEKKLNSKTLIDRMAPLKQALEIRGELKRISAASIGSSLPLGIELEPLIRSLLDSQTCVVIPLITSLGGRILMARLEFDQLCIETIHSGSEFDFKELSEEMISGSVLSARDLAIPSGENLDNHIGLDEISVRIGKLVTEDLYAKLESLPPEQRICNVILLPQGIWGHLPIGLGSIGNTKSPLLEHYTISLSPSLRLLDQVNSKKKNLNVERHATIIANPTHANPSIAGPLKFAAIEARLISQHFTMDREDILAEGEATKERIFSQLRGSTVWHFACHGAFDSVDGNNTRLYLAGEGVLTAADVLGNSDFCAPDLVVLSACETGLFDQTELPFEFTGLVSAFLQTGASGVIVSLWKVSDLATCFLMGALYDWIFLEGARVSEALRRAQLWLRDTNRSGLKEQIAIWVEAGAIVPEQAKELKSGLLEIDENQPFTDPHFWGGFVYYGAVENRISNNNK